MTVSFVGTHVRQNLDVNLDAHPECRSSSQSSLPKHHHTQLRQASASSPASYLTSPFYALIAQMHRLTTQPSHPFNHPSVLQNNRNTRPTPRPPLLTLTPLISAPLTTKYLRTVEPHTQHQLPRNTGNGVHIAYPTRTSALLPSLLPSA